MPEFHILNASNGHKMGESASLEIASKAADDLCTMYQQRYRVVELREVYTVDPPQLPINEDGSHGND